MIAPISYDRNKKSTTVNLTVDRQFYKLAARFQYFEFNICPTLFIDHDTNLPPWSGAQGDNSTLITTLGLYSK